MADLRVWSFSEGLNSALPFLSASEPVVDEARRILNPKFNPAGWQEPQQHQGRSLLLCFQGKVGFGASLMGLFGENLYILVVGVELGQAHLCRRIVGWFRLEKP